MRELLASLSDPRAPFAAIAGWDGVLRGKMGIDHADDRRALSTVFNGEFPQGFAQMKIASLTNKGTMILGGHFHPDYDELFLVVAGKIEWKLKQQIGDDLLEIVMEPGDTLVIPAGVAHSARCAPGTILIGFTGKPYIDAATNDRPFPISWD